MLYTVWMTPIPPLRPSEITPSEWNVIVLGEQMVRKFKWAYIYNIAFSIELRVQTRSVLALPRLWR